MSVPHCCLVAAGSVMVALRCYLFLAGDAEGCWLLLSRVGCSFWRLAVCAKFARQTDLFVGHSLAASSDLETGVAWGTCGRCVQCSPPRRSPARGAITPSQRLAGKDILDHVGFGVQHSHMLRMPITIMLWSYLWSHTSQCTLVQLSRLTEMQCDASGLAPSSYAARGDQPALHSPDYVLLFTWTASAAS